MFSLNNMKSHLDIIKLTNKNGNVITGVDKAVVNREKTEKR